MDCGWATAILFCAFDPASIGQTQAPEAVVRDDLQALQARGFSETARFMHPAVHMQSLWRGVQARRGGLPRIDGGEVLGIVAEDTL